VNSTYIKMHGVTIKNHEKEYISYLPNQRLNLIQISKVLIFLVPICTQLSSRKTKMRYCDF